MNLIRRPLVLLLVLATLTTSCWVGSREADSRHDPRNRGQYGTATIPTRPKLVTSDGGKRYTISKPWLLNLNGTSYRIQKGYTSNGITARPTVRDWLGNSVDSPETWAAMFHDWLFTPAGRAAITEGYSRAAADKLFYDLLLAYKVNPVKARLMYRSVSKYTEEKEREALRLPPA